MKDETFTLLIGAFLGATLVGWLTYYQTNYAWEKDIVAQGHGIYNPTNAQFEYIVLTNKLDNL